MVIKSLSDDQHLARHCPKNRLVTQGDEFVILPQAFALRPNEAYLSAAWVEYFEGTKKQRVKCILDLIRTKRTVSQKDGFALGHIGEIKATCSDFGMKIRVNHKPNGWNAAYATVNDYKSENQELLFLLATEAWSDLVLVKDC